MTHRLALVHFTENPDGSVTVDFLPAPRCDRCRHWTRDEGATYGTCGLAESNDGEPKYPALKAHAWDTESYHAALSTAPDFGCVQFEERTP